MSRKEPKPERIPDTLADGALVLEDLLGVGSQAQVWRAVDRRSGGEVAVKLVSLARSTPRFLGEAKVLSGIEHPHILRVRESGEEQGYVWFACDWYPAGTVQALVELCGALDSEQALLMAFDVCIALAALHK